MRVTFRPTVAADFIHWTREPLPHRIQAITAVIEDRVVGIGGIGFKPDGTVIAFAHLSEEMRRYPAAVQRAGRLGMALIRRSRVPLVIAEAQPDNPASARWLTHFGFQKFERDGSVAYVWRR